jgi:hypothetical protein
MRRVPLIPAILGLTLVVTAAPTPAGAASAGASNSAAAVVTQRHGVAGTVPAHQPSHPRDGFLPTGQELVRVAGRFALSGRARDSVVTLRVPHGHTYVIPSSTVPLVGGALDLSLFDAQLAVRHDSHRLAVQITHKGVLDPIPGIRITSDTGRVARGYLTATTARTFGAALALDQGVLDGVTISRPRAPRQPATRTSKRYPMRTIELTVANADERTGGLIMNLDDSSRYADALFLVPGKARLSVPVGHYHVFAYNVSAPIDDGGSGVNRLIEVDFEVTDDTAVQEFTLDFAQATSPVHLADPPRPVETIYGSANYARVDEPGTGRGGLLFEFETPYELRVQPYAGPALGAIDYSVLVSAFEHDFGDASSSYLYQGLYLDDQIAADQTYAIDEANLATVETDFHADREGVHQQFTRLPFHRTLPLTRSLPFTGGLSRTEYVDLPAGLPSMEMSDADILAEDATQLVPTQTSIYAAGETYHQSWHAGPIAPGFDRTSRPNSLFETLCAACRIGDTIGIGMDPITDSDPTHFGFMVPFLNGTAPAAMATLTEGGKRVARSPNATGVVTDVSRRERRFALTVDAIRYTAAATRSTRSHTRVGFSSKAGQGPLAPAEWHCAGCRVLPVLTAKLAYPENLVGQVQPGVSHFEVEAGRIQGAAPAAVTSVAIWLRPSNYAWTRFPASSDGDGHFHVDVDLPSFLGRSYVDVRVVARDEGGSVWDQTVERAFQFMGPVLDKQAAPRADSVWRQGQVRDACKDTASGYRCLARWRPGAGPGLLAPRSGAARVGTPDDGYGPTQIQSMYGLDPKAPGTTVAIVDAFDYPRAEQDLAAYRKAWGLPPCTTANDCFRKIDQRGGTDYPQSDAGWALEAALDIQAVSAACPRCSILLVEADTNQSDDMGEAVNRAVAEGATIVSNSYGSPEGYESPTEDALYYTHPGVAQLVSSGDFGFGQASFPASSPHVVAVGGTRVTRTQTGWRHRAWSGAGSGCSAFFAKPAWQQDENCLMRTVSDVSALADPATGLAVYDTFGLGSSNGWIVVGGTSLAAPLMAGMVAQRGHPELLDDAGYIYRHHARLTDVVGGTTGVCGGDYLCTAVAGYDAPTGVGTPYRLRGL